MMEPELESPNWLGSIIKKLSDRGFERINAPNTPVGNALEEIDWYTISRRVQIQHRTEIENKIDELIGEIENMGAHEKLTDAVVFLHDAFNAMADWEDTGRPGAA